MLRRIGRIYNDEITHELVYASNRLTDAVDQDPWARHPSVGHSARGAYRSWRALSELLQRGDGDAKVGLAKTTKALAEHRHDTAGGSPAHDKDYSSSPV